MPVPRTRLKGVGRGIASLVVPLEILEISCVEI
jgi:hypothetical protein